jgi:hypothetical protein
MQDFLVFLTAALCVAAAWWVVKRHRARVAAAAALKAQRQELWLRRLAQQKRVRERLSSLNEESLSLLESMPAWIESAENQLDQAELDFAEGAFAPFWNSVERAALSLARFDESVQKLESNSREYIDLRTHNKVPAPAFPVSFAVTTRMTLATATSNRMHGIVRCAQRDFQFSVIYEHRKTNQILVSGFRNLAQAVEEMASRITTSIDSLTTSVDKMTSTLEESLRRLSEQTGGFPAGPRNEVDRGESGREQSVLAILDRIEQKRYGSTIRGREDLPLAASWQMHATDDLPETGHRARSVLTTANAIA